MRVHSPAQLEMQYFGADSLTLPVIFLVSFLLGPRRVRKIDRSVLGGPKVGLCSPTDMKMYPFRVVDLSINSPAP